MKKTTNGFAKLTWAEFRKQVSVIVSSMTNNTHFPTLQTQVTALSAAADDYYVLDTKAEKRDKDVLVARNAARVSLTALLHQLGFAVSSIAAGSVEALTSSGFPTSKTAQKTAPLQKPKPPKLSLGVNSGVIDVKAFSQKGAKSAKFYIAVAPDTTTLEIGADATWEIISWNSTKYRFADLIPGKRYFIKVGLVGVRGQEVVSEPVSYISQ